MAIPFSEAIYDALNKDEVIWANRFWPRVLIALKAPFYFYQGFELLTNQSLLSPLAAKIAFEGKGECRTWYCKGWYDWRCRRFYVTKLKGLKS